MQKFSIVLFLITFLVGCGGGYQTSSTYPGSGMAAGDTKTTDIGYGNANVKVVQNVPINAEVIRTVRVIACKFNAFDPQPTQAHVNNLLTNKAARIGADGISNIQIYQPGSSVSQSNCWSRLAGEATAFKYSSGGTANNVEMTSMINDAKETCKTIGFEEGTEKFAECSLKLYSQSLELAAKNNQQVIMQPQSSGSTKVTIYDPVRDANALIQQGQRMMSGACTLGIDC